ncbi:MAG: serralysin [Gaiellales bacterium]|nr:serralysin [Gaiellales bacterium]
MSLGWGGRRCFCMLALAGAAVAWPASASSSTIFRGPAYKTAQAPTAHKPQSKLWFAGGRWWSILWNAHRFHWGIYRLDRRTHTWVGTGAMLDTRRDAHADAVADGDSVTVVSAAPPGTRDTDQRILLWQLSLSGSQWNASGPPVAPALATPEAVVLDQDSTGTVWVAYTDDNGGGGRRVLVTHSTSDTRHFTAPASPGVDGSEDLSDDDVVAIAAYGDRIGLLWSNQTRGSFVFASRPAGSGTTTWVGQTVLQGAFESDDHLSLKSPHDGSGRLYALVKTSLNDSRAAPDAPQMLLLALGDDGAWRSYPVWTIADRVTRPLLLLVPSRNVALVFASSPCCGGGVVYEKSTSMTAPAFAPGLGSPFIHTSEDLHLNNPTSTKQPLDPQMGIVVVASDDHTRTYATGVAPLPRAKP